MKITKIETVIPAKHPQLLLVQVHTDDGIAGLGEVIFGSKSVSEWVHSEAAVLLLGKDPLHIEKHWQDLYDQRGMHEARGVALRGLSALDIALWDIYGQKVGLPIHQLLGGPCRERIQIYNTCASYYHGTIDKRGSQPQGDTKDGYDDYNGFLHHADDLAESLLSEGVTAMKIWPFDQFASKTGGQSISLEDLKKGCEPFRKIRKAVGDRMEIALEMHSRWSVPAAIRIAKAVEEFEPMWLEDPIRMDNMTSLREFKEATRIPTAASEIVPSRWGFREMLEQRATSIVILDITWTGGISEARRIASLAEIYHKPIAPHDCTGPVALMASVHLCMNAPNALIQETVRAHYKGWYLDLVDRLPRIEDGYVYAPTDPGLGMALRPEILKQSDAEVRVSKL